MANNQLKRARQALRTQKATRRLTTQRAEQALGGGRGRGTPISATGQALKRRRQALRTQRRQDIGKSPITRPPLSARPPLLGRPTITRRQRGAVRQTIVGASRAVRRGARRTARRQIIPNLRRR